MNLNKEDAQLTVWGIMYRYRNSKTLQWETTVMTEALYGRTPEEAKKEYLAKSPYKSTDIEILEIRKHYTIQAKKNLSKG